MGIMNSIVSIGTIVLQSTVNGLGKITITAHTAACKIVEMFVKPLISISITITTFISQNLGVHKYDRILKGLRHSVLLCLIWVVMVIILSYTKVVVLLSLLINGENQEVISIASFYTCIMSLFYFALSFLFLYRNALQGLGKGSIPIVFSIIEMSVVLVWYFYHSMRELK